MASCALNTGPDIHLLDHIAPLAALKNMPLIVTEEENAILAAKYYPDVAVRYMPDLSFRLAELAQEFDTLYECKFWRPEFKAVFRTCYQKEMRLVFCPHGQSDKGYKAPLLAAYAFQDEVLLYGDLLREMLSELNIPLQSSQPIGNYRLNYYQANRERLDGAEIFSQLNSENKTLLYAPTWRDLDGATTFFATCEKLIRELPSHWNLILKLHPLLEQRDPALFYRLGILEEKRRGVVIVDKYPPVYPILEKIDAYLGDYSSVGYDVLAFEKPMFFLPLPDQPPARLHSCGQALNPEANFFEAIESKLKNAEKYKPAQQALYQKAFYSTATGGKI